MISSIQQRIFFSLYLQSKPWLADKMQQQSMDGPLKDYHVLMHLFGENNVLNCCLFSNKSIWNYLCSWGRTGDKMNTDYTCFTSELKAHPECKSFTNSSQNQQGSVVWKRLQSQNSSPSHIHTNTLISSNSSSPPYQERSSLLQPDMHRCSGNQLLYVLPCRRQGRWCLTLCRYEMTEWSGWDSLVIQHLTLCNTVWPQTEW